MTKTIKLSVENGLLVADPDVLTVTRGEKIKWEFVPKKLKHKIFLSSKCEFVDEIFREGVHPHKESDIKKNVLHDAAFGTWRYNIHWFNDNGEEMPVLDPKIVIEPSRIVTENQLLAIASVILLSFIPFAIKFFQRRTRS